MFLVKLSWFYFSSVVSLVLLLLYVSNAVLFLISNIHLQNDVAELVLPEQLLFLIFLVCLQLFIRPWLLHLILSCPISRECFALSMLACWQLLGMFLYQLTLTYSGIKLWLFPELFHKLQNFYLNLSKVLLFNIYGVLHVLSFSHFWILCWL